jgi:hypothetical protein
MQAEVEETLKRIEKHRGVIGVMIVNQEGKKFYFVIFVVLSLHKKMNRKRTFTK